MRHDTRSPALRLGAITTLALLTVLCLCGAARADTLLISEELSGHGRTEAEAEQDALNQAQALVAARLRERSPRSEWMPSAEYLLESGLVRKLRHDPEYRSERVGPLHQVTIKLELGEADVMRMLRQDRLQSRYEISFKVLAALAALLGLLGAYYRLEVATRGYYTGRLRAFLLVGLIAIGAGLWLAW
jgi:hypothetical protein